MEGKLKPSGLVLKVQAKGTVEVSQLQLLVRLKTLKPKEIKRTFWMYGGQAQRLDKSPGSREVILALSRSCVPGSLPVALPESNHSRSHPKRGHVTPCMQEKGMTGE